MNSYESEKPRFAVYDTVMIKDSYALHTVLARLYSLSELKNEYFLCNYNWYYEDELEDPEVKELTEEDMW